MLEALLVAKSEHGQALIVLGEAQLDESRARTRRVEAFERALEAARRRSGGARRPRAGARRSSARYEVAIASLGRAVVEAGGDRAILADAYRGLGIAWRRRGDLDKAIRELRKAVTEDGDDLDARAALGEALVADGGSVRRGAAPPRARRGRATTPPALALYGARPARRCSRDSPAIASERLAKARDARRDTIATPLGAQIRTRHPDRPGRCRARRARRDARPRLLPRGAAGSIRSAPICTRKIATAHRTIGNLEARCRATTARSPSAPGIDDPARRRRYRDRGGRRDPRAAVGQRSARARIRTDVRALVARGAAMIGDEPRRGARAARGRGRARRRRRARRARPPRARDGSGQAAHLGARRAARRSAPRAGAPDPHRGARGGARHARVPRSRDRRARSSSATRRRAAASSVTSSARSRAPPRTSISRCSSR